MLKCQLLSVATAIKALKQLKGQLKIDWTSNKIKPTRYFNTFNSIEYKSNFLALLFTTIIFLEKEIIRFKVTLLSRKKTNRWTALS